MTSAKICSSMTNAINAWSLMRNTLAEISGLSRDFCAGRRAYYISGQFGVHVIIKTIRRDDLVY